MSTKIVADVEMEVHAQINTPPLHADHVVSSIHAKKGTTVNFFTQKLSVEAGKAMEVVREVISADIDTPAEETN